ncbi:MAG: PriCT-2 domain-containing protein, partial [Bacteroidota bacterium]
MSDSKYTPTISFDINQVKKQFELLGHEPEKVCLRFFFHKDDSLKNEDKGRKAENLSLKELEKTVKRRQSEGYGAYFVVNGNGHTDNEIHHGFAIFCEHDDLDKSLQELLWKELGLPAPTFQVNTGGRSIHSYWVFNKPIEIYLWKILQIDLLDFAKADRQIKNPSRVMRLAGACHISPAGIFPSELINVTGNKYTYEELRSIIPEKAVESSPQPQTTANYSPKSNWSDVDWARSYLEALSPSRADDYNEWLSVGMALKAVSENLLPDWDNWSRQSTKYKPGECALKWESFKNPLDPKTEIAKLGSWAKQDGWVSPFKCKTDTSIKSFVSSKSNVNVDNGLLSTGVLTNESDDISIIQLIVSTVNAILGSNLSEFLERHKLNILYAQY